MATTISSGTNPYKLGSPPDFGTLYSGRALEFDGVSDYFGFTKIENLTEATVAFWLKTTNAGGGLIYNTGNAAALTHVRYSSGKISVINDTNPTGDIAISDGNWHRVIILFKQNGSGADYSLYIDGVEDTAGTFPATGVGSYSDVDFERFGFSTFYFDGSMTDCQIWDKNWSLSDVQYDYTHPEKLITDNSAVTSGTTISNLKAWYPCTEGNPRSPQTTVFDGSPKELGSELIGDGGFESGTDSWNYTNTTISQSTDYVKSGTYSLKAVQSGGSSDRTYKAFTAVVGKTYKFSFDTYKPSSGQDVAYIMRVATASDHDTPVSETISTLDAWVNTTGYFTATQTAFFIVAIPHNDSAGNDTVYIDNVSVKEVKMGNHGTTTFIGDELNAQANAITPSGSSASEANDAAGWTNAGMSTLASDTSYETTGTYSLKIVASSNGQYAHTNFTTVAGRSYRFSWDRTITNHDAQSKFDFKVGTSANNNSLGEIDSYASNTGTGTITGEYVDIVATTTSTFFTVAEDGSDNDGILYLDNLSVKEIGVATGWTTADAEPLIPQTALMGMSKPMVFDGSKNYVILDSSIAITNAQWTLSGWYYFKSFSDPQGYPHLFSLNVASVSYIRIKDDGSELYLETDSNGDDATLVFTTELSINTWYHIVVTRNGDVWGSYLNGTYKAFADETSGGNSLTIDRFGGEGNDSRTLNGMINEVSIWDDVLTLAEVQELFNDGVPLDATTHSASGDDLVGYWRNDGASSWEDRKGSNDGTPTGSPDTILLPEGTTTGKDILGFPLTHTNNGWLNLDGQSITGHLDYKQYVDFTEIDLGELCTLSCWAKRDNTTNNEMVFGNDASYVFYFNGANDVTIRVDDTNVLTFDVADVQTALARTNWVYWTFVRDTTTTGKLYVDGVLEDSDTNGSISGTTAISKIGSDDDGQYCFAGSIDESRAYNRALSATEILKNYKHGLSKHS